MPTLLLLTTLSLGALTIAGMIASQRPRACFAPGVLSLSKDACFDTPSGVSMLCAWLLSVNWNGDEDGKKSGGK